MDDLRDGDGPPSVSGLGVVDVSKSYGPVLALDRVSLEIAGGRVHAIVGENGAGKSTLMRLLQGLEQPDSGSVLIDGEPVQLRDARDAMRRGIGMVHQEFMLVPNLSLLENFVLGAEPLRRGPAGAVLVDWTSAEAAGDRLARQAGVQVQWSLLASEAPVHIRQIVEITRLLSRGATTIILDEPTSILAPRQVEDLFEMLREMRRDGATIVFISHKLKEVMALAEVVTVMRKGRVIATRPVSGTSIGELTELMVGEDIAINLRADSGELTAEEPVLCVQDLRACDDRGVPKLLGADLDLLPGEIHGIAGVSGNGQDELVECLAGLRTPEDGSIRIAGTDVTGEGNRSMREAGIAYASPDRGHEGLSLDAPIEHNIVAGDHRTPDLSHRGWLRLNRIRTAARQRLADLDVVYGSLKDPARSLSGGNQQRLVFARELAGAPRVLIAAQPTRGVDVKGIAAIHGLLREFRDRGGTVLLVSEELEELIALSDRISVVADGRIAGCVRGEDANLENLGRLMLSQYSADPTQPPDEAVRGQAA